MVRCMAACLPILTTSLISYLGELEARDVASSLWSCAAMGHYDRALFDTLCSKVCVYVCVHMCACVFSAMGHYDRALFDTLCSKVCVG
jgi:hypothetical protein